MNRVGLFLIVFVAMTLHSEENQTELIPLKFVHSLVANTKTKLEMVGHISIPWIQETGLKPIFIGHVSYAKQWESFENWVVANPQQIEYDTSKLFDDEKAELTRTVREVFPSVKTEEIDFGRFLRRSINSKGVLMISCAVGGRPYEKTLYVLCYSLNDAKSHVWKLHIGPTQSATYAEVLDDELAIQAGEVDSKSVGRFLRLLCGALSLRIKENKVFLHGKAFKNTVQQTEFVVRGLNEKSLWLSGQFDYSLRWPDALLKTEDADSGDVIAITTRPLIEKFVGSIAMSEYTREEELAKCMLGLLEKRENSVSTIDDVLFFSKFGFSTRNKDVLERLKEALKDTDFLSITSLPKELRSALELRLK